MSHGSSCRKCFPDAPASPLLTELAFAAVMSGLGFDSPGFSARNPTSLLLPREKTPLSRSGPNLASIQMPQNRRCPFSASSEALNHSLAAPTTSNHHPFLPLSPHFGQKYLVVIQSLSHRAPPIRTFFVVSGFDEARSFSFGYPQCYHGGTLGGVGPSHTYGQSEYS